MEVTKNRKLKLVGLIKSRFSMPATINLEMNLLWHYRVLIIPIDQNFY